MNIAAGSVSQDLPRAEQLAAEAIERDPESSKAHEAMGRVRLIQKNRLREAQIEFEKALSLDRNNLAALRNLGWSSLNLGEPEACIGQGEKGLRLSPHDPAVWSFLAQLGVCHLVLNHADLAADYLIKARGRSANMVASLVFSRGAGSKRRSRRGEGGACRVAQDETGDRLDRQFYFPQTVVQHPKAHGAAGPHSDGGTAPPWLSRKLRSSRGAQYSIRLITFSVISERGNG